MDRGVLNADEAERQRLSRCLQDEVSQQLLGVRVRMLVLDKVISDNHESVVKEINITRQLLAQSLKIIRSLDRTRRAHHEI